MTVNADDLLPAGQLPAGQLPDTVIAKTRLRAVHLPRSPKAITGLIIIAVFALLTLIGPWIAPFAPNDNAFAPNLHPSAAHWLGTSNLGADIFSQLLNGARATMVVGFVAGLIATLLSVIIGITAGYIGGGTDEGLSLAANMFLAIPGLPLLIVIDSYLPASGRSNTLLIGVIISVTGWAWGARVVRARRQCRPSDGTSWRRPGWWVRAGCGSCSSRCCRTCWPSWPPRSCSPCCMRSAPTSRWPTSG